MSVIKTKNSFVELQQNIWDSDSRSQLYQHKRALFTRELLRHCDGIALDIGSGEGFILDALADGDKLQYVAAELDKDLLELAKKNMKNKYRVDLVCASVFHLPFRDNSFDIVMLLEVIEHLLNIGQLPKLISRIIKSEGMLVISTPYKEKIRYYKCPQCNKFTPLYGHLHSFDERKIQKLFNPYFNALKFEHTINQLAIMGPLLYLPFKTTYFLNKIFNRVFGKRGYWLIAKLEPATESNTTFELTTQRRV